MERKETSPGNFEQTTNPNHEVTDRERYFTSPETNTTNLNADALQDPGVLVELSSQKRLPGQEFNTKQLSRDLDKQLGFQSIFRTPRRTRVSLYENFKPVENLCREDVKNIQHLADGGMCRIMSGEFCGNPCVVKIALPVEKYPNQGEIQNSLQAELSVLRQVKHPNIVAYFGSGVQPEDQKLFIVMERLEGSLSQGFGKKGTSGQYIQKIDILDSMKWALEIALGMSYLHNEAIPGRMIIHRDLKPDNVCFGRDGYLKIMDLGLAKIVDRPSRTGSELYTMTGEVGSARYTAPEVALHLPYNEKADVYSFAMVFWQMLSGMPPFSHVGSSEELKQRLRKGERPSLNKKWTPELKCFLQQCWNQEMMSRPSFSEIVNLLQAMIANHIKVSRSPKLQKKSLLQMAFGCWCSK